jgi:hypothetical protein
LAQLASEIFFFHDFFSCGRIFGNIFEIFVEIEVFSLAPRIIIEVTVLFWQSQGSKKKRV